MRIGIAQINCHLGAFFENANKIIDKVEMAKDRHCDLVVFPELSLFGYWPADLLERKELIKKQTTELKKLEKKIPKDIAVLFGAVCPNTKKTGKFFHNSAVLMQKGKKSKIFNKELLPNYDVFDEARHFEPGDMSKNFFRLKGKKVLVTICEDIWGWGDAWVGTRYAKNPLVQAKKLKPDIVLNLSASPFSLGKDKRRKKVVKKTAQYLNAPVVYTNLVGGQDELVFDGGSFAMSKTGKVLCQSLFFEEDFNFHDFKLNKGGHKDLNSKNQTELTRQAIVVGIRDFVEKNGFKKVHLGSSGGIDSALLACLAVDALGANNVKTFAMPGPHSSKDSLNYAKELAKNIGCEFEVLDINNSYNTVLNDLKSGLGGFQFGVTNENLQARLRGLFLMAYSNLANSLLLSTSNKSEIAVGYATLYGDMCGGLAPLGDLLKTQVYELSNLYNEQAEVIPKAIIERPPTAELRPDQKDEDSLPPYNKLDPLLQKFIVDCKDEIGKTEKEIHKKIYANEFKRWQGPPILRVSQHAFGTGRRYPITVSGQ